jgi:hypothetical protein
MTPTGSRGRRTRRVSRSAAGSESRTR